MFEFDIKLKLVFVGGKRRVGRFVGGRLGESTIVLCFLAVGLGKA